jgi:hypothetical protein
MKKMDTKKIVKKYQDAMDNYESELAEYNKDMEEFNEELNECHKMSQSLVHVYVYHINEQDYYSKRSFYTTGKRIDKFTEKNAVEAQLAWPRKPRKPRKPILSMSFEPSGFFLGN